MSQGPSTGRMNRRAAAKSVMALGGYNGTDPSITLTAFEALAASGKIHYYLPNSQGFIGSTSSTGSSAYAIQQWVEQHYASTAIGSTTVYDMNASSTS